MDSFEKLGEIQDKILENCDGKRLLIKDTLIILKKKKLKINRWTDSKMLIFNSSC
ncbi:hypothetical protein [uncultured Methanobrevibacter sp.]|uniref:hypothetical protein n=1 Tax=uncultured Methanobrevibacter sp. TaxID=253161 RepID=UPI002631EB73|nr:hypothetical protein [uncultured Methanobrevibacter sp.]